VHENEQPLGLGSPDDTGRESHRGIEDSDNEDVSLTPGFTLACLGDVMLARGVSEVLEHHDADEVWGDTLAILRRADLRLANLECCISERGCRFDPPRTFHFRAIPKAFDSLRAAHINVVTLANNHVLDYGEEALLDTLGGLDWAGIKRVGAGHDLTEAEAPVVLDARGGMKLGVVGFTDNFPEYGATSSRPGTFHVDVVPSGVERVARSVARARELGADLVVVTAHWGPNMRERPPDNFRDFARATIERGADMWFGHSAHIFQGVEFHKGKPIVYDAGDFVDDYAVDGRLRNDRSLLWMASFEDGAVTLSAYPVQLSFARTDRAHGDSFEWIAARAERLCAELGTVVRQEEDRLVFRPD
jgi:poly-gamma-glutamate synthesis protein (capsule biosynthesis protein)